MPKLLRRGIIACRAHLSFQARQTRMALNPRYDEPFHWWGPGGHARPVPTVQDLLRAGTIDVAQAAVVWAALARRLSLVILAAPSGAGKTTVLTALLELLPPGTRRIYLRGCYETFAFSRDPDVLPAASVLLINEISPHLPVYLWGPAVARALDEVARGFMVLATAHADSVPAFVGALAGSPLRIPAPGIAAFSLAVVLGPSRPNRSGQTVKEIVTLSATRDGVTLASFPDWTLGAAPGNPAGPRSLLPDPRVSAAELTERRLLLEALRAGRIERLPAFRVLTP